MSDYVDWLCLALAFVLIFITVYSWDYASVGAGPFWVATGACCVVGLFVILFYQTDRH